MRRLLHVDPRSPATRRPALRRVIVAFLLAAAIGLPAASRAERLFLPREQEGPWLASDKTLHFAASFAIAVSLRVEGQSEATSAGVTIGVGVAKELYDATLRPAGPGSTRGASRRDLVMDLLGTAAGILFIRAIDR